MTVILLFRFGKLLVWNKARMQFSFIIPRFAIHPTVCQPPGSPHFMYILGYHLSQFIQLCGQCDSRGVYWLREVSIYFPIHFQCRD